MKFKTLIDKYPFAEVWPALLALYPDQDKNREGYENVHASLRQMTPRPSDCTIVFSLANDILDHSQYVDVSGRVPGYELLKAIEFSPWDEWLGMEIDLGELSDMPEVFIVAHCLWEMTFVGFDEMQIQQVLWQVNDKVQAYKSRYN